MAAYWPDEYYTGSTTLMYQFTYFVREFSRETDKILADLNPRNWRWFHGLARPQTTSDLEYNPDYVKPPRRVQERYPMSAARANKRRSFVQSLYA